MRLKIKFLSIFFLTVLLGAFTVKSAFADSLTLSGHLTDRTGSGVGGVNIALTHDQGDTVVATAQTDGSGFYSIQATSGSYEVRIIGDPQNASSVLPETIRLITSGDSVSLTQDTTLDLQIPSSLVTVHVQDPSQNPVENAFVRVSTGGQITVGSLQFNVIEGLQNGHTDVSGNVTIPALPGTATISVTSPTATLSNASVSQVITGDTTLVISLQFNNNPPHINTLSGGTINEGQTYSENGSFTDPDSTSWTGRVDYGDGSGEHDFASPNESIDQTNHTFSISHVYKDNGTYTVTVKITDNQGAVSNPATATVTVNNVAPTPGAITISPNPVQINTSVTATVNFTDPGVLDTHSATAQWGDGSSDTSCTITEPSGSTPGTASCPRPSGYAAANVYPVTIKVSDGTDTGTSPVDYASVYSPTAQGLFSAGQRFSNPGTASPSTSGNVTFGLSYKYQGTMPTSDRQFTMDFKAANLHFNATDVTSLVVANSMATLIGTGTITGRSGTFNFLVTGVNGGDIRIQITDSSNNIIYDTQPGDPITATPTTSVNGQVIAHN